MWKTHQKRGLSLFFYDISKSYEVINELCQKARQAAECVQENEAEMNCRNNAKRYEEAANKLHELDDSGCPKEVKVVIQFIMQQDSKSFQPGNTSLNYVCSNKTQLGNIIAIDKIYGNQEIDIDGEKCITDDINATITV